jgi:hypothetical protein
MPDDVILEIVRRLSALERFQDRMNAARLLSPPISNADIDAAAGILLTKLATLQPGFIPMGAAGFNSAVSLPRKNLLFNGSMRVSQRLPLLTAVTAVDNAYQVADRWKTLAQAGGGGWGVYNHNAAPAPGPGRSLLFNSGGNGNKVGAIQILENQDTIQLRSQQVSAQIAVFASSNIGDVRMALMSWVGTADAPVHPFTGAGGSWGASGTNPTPATNWSFLSTPTNLGPAAAYATKKLEGLTVPAGCNNLALVVWCEDTTQTVSTDSWAFSHAQLELGAVCTAVERVRFVDDYLPCLRYYQQSYVHGTAPGTVTSQGEVIGPANVGVTLGGSVNLITPAHVRLMTPMRTTPTTVLYSSGNGAANAILINGITNVTTATAGFISANVALAFVGITSASAAFAAGAQVQYHWTASAEL